MKKAKAPEEGKLASLVDALCDASGRLERSRPQCEERHPLPSREAVTSIVEALRTVLFPGYFGPSELNQQDLAYHIGSTLVWVQRELKEQLRRGSCFVCRESPKECEKQAEETTQAFLARLPAVRELLETDVRAAYEGDPASTSPDEAIFCYPGVLAVMNYRLAHELHLLDVPLIPRMITEHAHSITGIDIHPGATIGESFFIDHGTGVVIGETGILGKRVQLYQGVTLGAKSFPLDEDGNPIKGIPRHPIVEDDVTIYAEATILGRVTIGKGSVIGGNVWLTRSVPPNSTITQNSARKESFERGSGI